jgi:branched-chain amino acid transport system ATP-binding protein
MLSVADLEAGYGRTPVLHGVDVHVDRGEFVAILGANGAGKTTLLKTIAGLTRPWSGRLELDGRDVTRMPSDRRVADGLVLVPEGRQIFGGMSVRTNLRLGAYTRRARPGMDDREAAIYERFPRLAERRDQLAGTLSGGEQQMLALGRGLMADPRVLLLDEPSLGLAPLAVDDVFEPLRALRGELTVIVVEQDAGRALDICDRAYVLEQGEIRLEGDAAELAGDPRLQAAYIGMEVAPA